MFRASTSSLPGCCLVCACGAEQPCREEREGPEPRSPARRQGRGRRRSPPGRGSGLEPPCEESKHFGRRNWKASATAAPRRMRAAAAGWDGGAGWEDTEPQPWMKAQEGVLGQHRSRPAARPAAGHSQVGAQLPPELVFRPRGRASISVSVNLGHILISLIVKKNKNKNPKRPKKILCCRVAAQSSVPGW